MNKSKSFLFALAGCALSLFAFPSAAQERATPFIKERKTDVWLSAGLLSYHFDRSKNYRELNYGIGGEAIYSSDHAFMAGIVNNSESHTTKYVGYQYRPLHWKPYGVDVSAGLAISLLDGYPSQNNGGWFIAPLPMVSVEGKRFGVNFILIPNVKHGAAVAMQLKMKVW